MSQQTIGSVEGALSNLQSIKSGDDPRTTSEPEQPELSPDTESVEFLDPDDLVYRTGEHHRDRDMVHEIFLELVNIVEPHNEYGNYEYPINKLQLETSYCKKTSSYNAKCGPRTNGVFFACDIDYVSEMSTERFFVLLVHELTHVTEGSQTQGSAHNPTFWSTMVENAVTVFKAVGQKYDIDRDGFFTHVRENPNSPMVDKRMVTVEEQKQRNEDQILSLL